MRSKRAWSNTGEAYVYRFRGGYRVNMPAWGKRERMVDTLEEAIEIRDRFVEELRASGVDVPKLRRATFRYWGEFRLDGRRRWDEAEMRAVEDEEARVVWDMVGGFEGVSYYGWGGWGEKSSR